MPYGFAAAAAITAAGTIGSGIIGADATKSAANQQAEQAQNALALQTRQFDTTQQNVQPYINSGQNALQSLNQLLGLNPGGNPVTANPILQMLGIGGPGPAGGINPATFTGSPGYQYELQQGQNAITNKATTGPGGGNALLALQKNGQQLANQNWGNYLSELSPAWQQLLSNVGGQAGQGLSAAGTLAGLGQSNINSQSSILAGLGNSQAAGTIGSANALTGGISGGLQGVNGLLTNPNTISALNNYINNSSNTSAFNAASSGVNTFNAGNPFGS